MKTSSCKAKGRRLQDYVVEKLQSKYSLLNPDNIRPAIMGESGADVKLSPLAKSIIPFDIECKNVEKLNVWSALEQAELNSEEGRIPIVVFKRNHSKTYVVVEFNDFLGGIK